ncbi:LOB domain-containing protein 38 [Prunus dulcis]|uniref:LOB domain-containing protein 38 n=1 Tax=Prunus dulcis TaxID=3755 RepID=A0A4Y1RPP9_PRUDU|nr:LOB domain-containing protein 38 [Prunus dulcis]
MPTNPACSALASSGSKPRSPRPRHVFVAKFFGRAGLMSFISAVPDSQRPVLFQSLLFEACGRTVNPVNAPWAALDRQLARVPGRGRDRAPRRHAAADTRAPRLRLDFRRSLRRRWRRRQQLYGHVEAPRSEPQLRFFVPVHQLPVRQGFLSETQAIRRRGVVHEGASAPAPCGSGSAVDSEPDFQTEAQTRDPTSRNAVDELRGVGGHHVLREGLPDNHHQYNHHSYGVGAERKLLNLFP